MSDKKTINKSDQIIESQRKPELNIEDLVVRYDTEDAIVHAVNGVSLQVEQKSTLGLVGETGAGKTTTALSVMRLIPSPPGKMISGKIEFFGKNIMEYSENEMETIRGDIVSMVFQDPMTSLNPVFTVGEQIREVIEIHQDLSASDAEDKMKEMLELVGIPSQRASEYPHQFSGGMKQRVVIAIALACNPRILIADEPTTALDVTIQAQVLELMQELKETFNTAMILITHDLGVVAEICDYVAIMYAGRIIEYGKIEDIFDNFKHPYTEGLFGALPNLQKRHEKLSPIEGMMPDPSDLPSGCSFHPRCKYATEICKEKRPEKVFFGTDHYVECLAYREGSMAMWEG